eukprot:2467738-Amphidinium_carterae.1
MQQSQHRAHVPPVQPGAWLGGRPSQLLRQFVVELAAEAVCPFLGGSLEQAAFGLYWPMHSTRL